MPLYNNFNNLNVLKSKTFIIEPFSDTLAIYFELLDIFIY